MGGINFDHNNLAGLGANANKKAANTPSAPSPTNEAPTVNNTPTVDNSGKVLDFLGAQGNYAQVGISLGGKTAIDPRIASLISPSVAAQIKNTDPASAARIGQFATQGYNAASNAGF